MSAALQGHDLQCKIGTLQLDASLQVSAGQPTVIVGPNGSGKSTLLRVIAGLQPIESGTLRCDGQVIDDPTTGSFVPADARPVSLVFQDQRLFPHLTARENVAFALRAAGGRRRAALTGAAEHLAATGADPGWFDHRPHELSGGQQQRVAIARAVATGARVLLFDEPFASIDKAATAPLRQIISQLDATVIMVTHDPVTARLVADQVLVMDGGRIVQHGPPSAIATQPATPWVAELLDQNLLEGSAAGTEVELDGGGQLTTATHASGPVAVSFGPSGVTLSVEPPVGSARNVWRTRVADVVTDGDRVRVRLDAPIPCWATVTPSSAERLGLSPGRPVTASVKATEIAVQQR